MNAMLLCLMFAQGPESDAWLVTISAETATINGKLVTTYLSTARVGVEGLVNGAEQFVNGRRVFIAEDKNAEAKVRATNPWEVRVDNVTASNDLGEVSGDAFAAILFGTLGAPAGMDRHRLQALSRSESRFVRGRNCVVLSNAESVGLPANTPAALLDVPNGAYHVANLVIYNVGGAAGNFVIDFACNANATAGPLTGFNPGRDAVNMVFEMPGVTGSSSYVWGSGAPGYQYTAWLDRDTGHAAEADFHVYPPIPQAGCTGWASTFGRPKPDAYLYPYPGVIPGFAPEPYMNITTRNTFAVPSDCIHLPNIPRISVSANARSFGASHIQHSAASNAYVDVSLVVVSKPGPKP